MFVGRPRICVSVCCCLVLLRHYSPWKAQVSSCHSLLLCTNAEGRTGAGAVADLVWWFVYFLFLRVSGTNHHNGTVCTYKSGCVNENKPEKYWLALFFFFSLSVHGMGSLLWFHGHPFMLVTKTLNAHVHGAYAENQHSTDTVFLVGMLMSVVGGVFVLFALMALCYRSVVVHQNFSLCLRLVPSKIQNYFLYSYK